MVEGLRTLTILRLRAGGSVRNRMLLYIRLECSEILMYRLFRSVLIHDPFEPRK